MKSTHFNALSNYELPKTSSISIQGGSGTVTVLDTDMESIVKQD